MYLNHFHFKSMPFAMSPDSGFLYVSAQHSAALTMLEFAMESQAPFCLLTGEIGSGKTTVIRRLLRILRDQPVTVGLVSHSHGRFRSIHPWALSALGIVDDDESEIGQFEALNDFFIREYGRGRRTLLIFDEAQNLSIRTLEELRLLSNVNSENDVALQIMLVGQPELRRKLQRPELKQFAQRVSIDFHLGALTLPETEAYVRHRLNVAGGSDAIFDHPSIELIHERSDGIPRVINQLCDMCLVYAFAEGLQQVTAPIVVEVLRDKSRGHAIQPTAPTASALTNATAVPPMVAATPPAAPAAGPRTNSATSPSMSTAMPLPAAPTAAPATNGAASPPPMSTAMPRPATPTAALTTNGGASPPMSTTMLRPAAPIAALETNGAASPPMSTTMPPAAPIAALETNGTTSPPKIAATPPPARAAVAHETEGTVRRPQKIGRLPLNIGMSPARQDVAQPKKPRSRTFRSWFFFS